MDNLICWVFLRCFSSIRFYLINIVVVISFLSAWQTMTLALSPVTNPPQEFIKNKVSSTPSRGDINKSLDCALLQPGQYFCSDPDIIEENQTAENCSESTRTVKVPCRPVKGIWCNGSQHTGNTVGFYKEVPCRWTNEKHFSTALLLSVFLGMFGVDRFYLGYPAIGLLKLCTLGFMFLGQLVDVILIAMQVIGPSDGSDYVIDYFGAALTRVERNNFTYTKPQYDSLITS